LLDSKTLKLSPENYQKYLIEHSIFRVKGEIQPQEDHKQALVINEESKTSIL
jgi:hypothetical protein